MNLGKYLESIDNIIPGNKQKKWLMKLEEKCKTGISLYLSAKQGERAQIWNEFNNRVRTEEIKAWYSEPHDNSLFQGTSVSSLTIPYTVPQPLRLNSISELEDIIANAYIKLHLKNVDKVKNAIQENVDEWISQGLYYGVVVCSKVISQAFGLTIFQDDAIFDVDSYRVDPHEIISYPKEVRTAYFEKCKDKIECFSGIDLEQRELESSLVLADISKPKIKDYKDKIMLAPVRCNEIAAVLSKRVVEKIVEKTSGKIRPKSLAVIIYDTDTPYTYHEIMGYSFQTLSPTLPGLTILGSSGTIDAFRWLYAYRVSLIAQKMQKGSLYSQVHESFMPFVFLGVLVWRDAQILLDMNSLSMLRYKGNISPDLEFAYLISDSYKKDIEPLSNISWGKYRKDHYK